jgi:hypothetical protein
MTTFALYKSFFGSAPRIGEAKAKQFGFFGQRSRPNQIKPPRCGLASPMRCRKLCSSKPYSGLLFIFLIQKELGKLRGV